MIYNQDEGNNDGLNEEENVKDDAVIEDVVDDKPSNEKNTDDGNNDENDEMNIEDLDNMSMVLLLALSEYLNNANETLEKAFENVVYKQPVQIDDEDNITRLKSI